MHLYRRAMCRLDTKEGGHTAIIESAIIELLHQAGAHKEITYSEEEENEWSE